MTTKADYVRAQPQTRNHACHWQGCTEQVPPAMWGCKRHWFALPATLRARIWAAYRPGQEKDGRPSEDYLAVAHEVQAWIADLRASGGALHLFMAARYMPALSYHEPWASLHIAGFKLHETRHWPTKVRGQVAIHAAAKCDVLGAPTDLCNFALGEGWAKTRPASAVIGVANLTGCFETDELVRSTRLSDADVESGNFARGRYAFRFEDVRPLKEPIPVKGGRGFFRWAAPEDLDARLLPVIDQRAISATWKLLV
jgi:hypothetical protein